MAGEHLDKLINDGGRAFRTKNKRWFLICLAMTQLGFFYNVQAPTALQKPLQEVLHINEFEYSLIILAQSLPNIGLPIIIGMLIDKYGASIGLAAGMFFGMAGQGLLTVAIYTVNFPLFLFGTIMCYIGVELLFLGKSKMVRLWYKDNEIPGITSVSIFIQSLGIILCDVSYPTIYTQSNSLGLPFAIGLGICTISLLFGTLKIGLHQKYMSQATKLATTPEHHSLSETWKSVKSYPILFWVITAASALSFGAYNATKAFESKFLIISFQFKVNEAGYILASGLVASGIVGPMAGVLLDKTGKLAKGMIVSAIIILVGIVLNANLPECEKCLTPTIPFMLMVLGSSVRGIVAISSAMRLIPHKNIGMALALLTMMSAVVNVSYPPIAGAISQATIDEHKYYWVFMTNALVCVVGVTLAFLAHIMDMRGSKKLQYAQAVGKHSSFYSVEGMVERSIHDPNLKGINETDEENDLDRSKTEHAFKSTPLEKSNRSGSFQF